MKIIKNIKIELTAEEYQIITKAQNILLNIEEEKNYKDYGEQIEEKYVDYVEGVKHSRALPTAIDFLDMLKREYIVEENMDEDE